MKQIFKLIPCLQILLCFSITGALSQSIELKQLNDSIEILHNKKRVLLYLFNANQFKPYIKELYTLDGRNILLDSPPDHIHHHGLMYGITVNGINFWEEGKDAGVEFPLKILHSKTKSQDNLDSAEFTQIIHWVSSTNRENAKDESAALLVESRTIKLFIDKESDELLLEWTGEFTVPKTTAKVLLSGTDYHGLGVRFPRAFDKTARHFNQKDLPYQTAGKHNLIEAQWAATTGLLEGKPVTLFIITPNSVKGRSIFFSMTDPFAYLSATQGINKEPLTYQSGERFSIRYLIIVAPKELTATEINKRRKFD